MIRFMLGIVAGAMLMGSAVYADDWYESWQSNVIQQQQLDEMQRQTNILEQQNIRDSFRLDPC